MAITFEAERPVSGGGFGDVKTCILKLAGAYETGGFGVGFTNEPMFIAVDNGLGAVWDGTNNKVKLMDGTSELADDASVVGVKVLFLLKGSF